MDALIFSGDFPAWLSWTRDALFIVDVCVGLLVILLVSCLIRQLLRAGHAEARKGMVAH